MSEVLWVHTPGGYRVATDEVLALMEWVERFHRRSANLRDDLERHRCYGWAPALAQACTTAGEVEDWSRWMSVSLDTYTRQVAQHERTRTALFDRPRDTALSAVSTYFAGGRSMTKGGIRQGAAAALGDYSPHAQVEEVSRIRETTIARGVAERIARIPDTDTPIRIDSYRHPDGSGHVEVFIAGTAEFNRDSGGSAFDMSSNLPLVARLSSASMMATQKAMAVAGVRKTDSVVFVGHSQGGAIAARLAESGRYTTAGLITIGAPTGSAPITGNYPALLIEHRDDVVPQLGGAREDTNAYVVTARSDALPGDVVGAHDREAYLTTAQRVDDSPAEELQRLTQSLPEGLSGETRVFREREG